VETSSAGEVTYPGRACKLKAFVVEPAAEGARAAVIVVQEWWGLNDHIRDVARRFAREGYFRDAPDLYSAARTKSRPSRIWPLS